MSEQDMPRMEMDADNLYREENYTDARVGSIRCLVPVKSDGSDDDSRSVRYLGSTQVMTEAGALPINFEIEADNLASAIAQFDSGAHQALEEMMKKAEEMRREQASKIMTPGDAGGMGGMGGGQGGMPGGGGGGLQMP
ncbi:hypothetical protein J2T60_001759 [Natronospira proteinivora]|uniref:Cytoplasmic protein n=1 Tax=Natronospira proteinivora TaxID=1807133 RepID=A0ABT1G8W1_9GAMM|nr:hypothetical protein [Natronospira proteinivora]MCP1727759.1 hypothetical protein [Natronospira proteinivora]